MSGELLAEWVASKYERLPSKLSHDVKVMFCGADLSSQHIGKDTKKARFIEDIEFVRFESCRRSTVCQEKRSLRVREIADGTSTHNIWLERMQPLAKLSRHVRVLDSYAIKNCFEYSGTSGLKSLFKNLSESGTSFDLEIYAAQWCDPVTDIEAMMHSLIAETGPHWLNNLDLYLVDKDIFRSYRHSRYIRFDHFVCETDKGVAVLDGTKLRVPSTYLLKNVERTHRDTEKHFRYYGERVVICS